MKRLIFLLTLLSSFAFGQAITGAPVVVNQNGSPLGSAMVGVCTTNPGSGICPVYATLYTDNNLSVACTGVNVHLNNISSPTVGSGCSNPGHTDFQGNVVAFAAVGFYWCQYKGTGITTYSQPCPTSGGSGGGGGGTVTGATTNGGLVLSGTTLGLFQTCAAGQTEVFNGTMWVCADGESAVVVTPNYNWDACPVGCTYTSSPNMVSGVNTITLTPVPLGVNATDIMHYIRLTFNCEQEFAPITGGTAVSGAASGTITFTAFCNHGNGHLGSATSGVQEAANTMPTSGGTLKLIPGTTYSCDAPIRITGPEKTFDGQGAVFYPTSFSSCIILGDQSIWDSTWTGGARYQQDIEHFTFDNTNTPTGWSVTPTGSIPGNSPTATLNITTCPSGFYPFPNQLLWLAGTNNGSPTTVYGYGEWVVTTGGTCTPGNAGTINIEAATPYGTANGIGGACGTSICNLDAHSAGFTLSNNVIPVIEDSLFGSAHIHDLRFISANSGGQYGEEIQIDNDQGGEINSVYSQGNQMRNDQDFQSANIYSPGPGGGLTGAAGIMYLHGLNFTQCGSRCVSWFADNDLSITDGVFQNFSVSGIQWGTKRGGFPAYSLGPNVHFEVGGIISPWGNLCCGNPAIMVTGGVSAPILNYSKVSIAPSFGVTQPYPQFSSNVASILSFTGSSGTLTFTTFNNNIAVGQSVTLNNFGAPDTGLNGQVVTVSSASPTQFQAAVTGSGYVSGGGTATFTATHTMYYYLIARNNTLTGCTSGGDCYGAPIFIGNAIVDDPSVNNVPVQWFGWGDNNIDKVSSISTNPTSYDLLRVSSTSGFPAAPTATANIAVITGVLPATACSIHNVCTITDNVAPGSLSSYTPVYISNNAKGYYANTMVLPGVVSLSSLGGTQIALGGITTSYRGTPSCFNSNAFFGYYGGPLLAWPIEAYRSFGNEVDPITQCPRGVFPISYPGNSSWCLSSASPASCSNQSTGVVAMPAGSTTLTVNSLSVTNWSHIKVWEDMTQGALLGVTCNTTQGRTYSITSKTDDVSFVITTNSAPSVNPACLHFEVDNTK